MTHRTQRRRLLAGLVFVGLAPVEALAQSHVLGSAPSSTGSSSSAPASGSAASAPASAPPAPPLPNCVLDQVTVSSGVLLSSRVDTGNIINGFILTLPIPNSGLKLTGLKRSDTDPLQLRLTCALAPDKPGGFEIQETRLSLPELTFTKADGGVASVDESTLKIGAKTWKHDAEMGFGGTDLDFDDISLDQTQLDSLSAALRQGGALTFQAVDDDDGKAKVSLTYTVPRITTVFAAAKPRLDKLKSDAVAGLCVIPPTDQGSYAKFCTTATIEVLGLRRNCWELKSLHRFREWMRADPIRAIEAEDYSFRAPAVVYAIAQRKDAIRVWLGAYFTGILPAAALARLGFNRAARLIYRAMCLDLVRRAGLQQT